MWIAGSEGLFRYDGKQEFKPSTDFTTLIRKVTLGNDSVIFNGNYTELVNGNFNILANQAKTNFFSLKYADNDLRFEYACPFFDNESETHYSYMLEGFDDKWSEWTKETTKEYTNLFEKNYKFRVKAKNVYGDESKEAVYELTILPPWYRTWWAYIMYILLAGAGIWGIVRVNSARLKAQNVKLEKTVKERTIEITQKNQELEQQKEEILAQHDAISEKNQKLGIAFQEINQQKEEIEAQRDNLEIANQEINQQKEEIETQRDNIAAQKQQVEKAYDNIQILSEIGQKITSILDIKTIIHTVYENVNKLMLAEAFGIGIYYPKTKEIYFEGFVEKGDVLPIHYHKLDEKVLAVMCFNEQKNIFINHLSSEYQNYFDEPLQVVAGEIPQSVIYLPLTLEDKTIGVITVQSFKANAYTNFHLTMLNSLASYIAIALDNAGAYQIIDAKNTQITGSIRYAQTIQQAILPSQELLNTYFAEHFVLYQPKDVVSGDFYWLSVIKNKETQVTETVFMGLMDCTGHGVPGAFMSLIGNTLLNKIVANNPKILPAQLLDELHNEIKIALNQDDEANKDGMDACLVQFDYQTKSDLPNVFFAGAKRPLYVMNKKGDLAEYKGSRKSIGGKQKEDLYFDNKSVSLSKGDTIYFTTDGYSDQNNTKRESMGSAFFKEFLRTIYQENAAKQHELLLKKLKDHQGNEEQRDDISVIGVKL
jgi:serine phosphatase RsbU (regulator of sigma subunit)